MALDEEGNRCPRQARWVGQVFLDLISPDLDAEKVWVELCGIHAEGRPKS